MSSSGKNTIQRVDVSIREEHIQRVDVSIRGEHIQRLEIFISEEQRITLVQMPEISYTSVQPIAYVNLECPNVCFSQGPNYQAVPTELRGQLKC